MRYGLVRVRENAESIAFYGGQSNEMAALMQVSTCCKQEQEHRKPTDAVSAERGLQRLQPVVLMYLSCSHKWFKPCMS